MNILCLYPPLASCSLVRQEYHEQGVYVEDDDDDDDDDDVGTT